MQGRITSYKKYLTLFNIAAGTLGGIASASAETMPTILYNMLFDEPAPILRSFTWDEIISEKSTEYDRRPAEQQSLSAGLPDSPVTLIQVEDSISSIHAIVPNHKKPQYYAPHIFNYHGEMAAFIADQAADERAGLDIQTHCIIAPHWSIWGNTAVPSNYRDVLFENADVLSYSMVPISTPAFSAGTNDTRSDINRLDEFWQNNNAILVAAAGNNGDIYPQLERQNATDQIRADTYIRVGATAKLKHGFNHLVADYSSYSAPSIVVTNPFDEGFTYPYIIDENALMERCTKLFNTLVENHMGASTNNIMTAKELFDDYLMRRFGDETISSPLMYITEHFPDFDTKILAPDNALLQTPLWQKDNPDAVRSAYIDALKQCIPMVRAQYNTNEQGHLTHALGTSFTTPLLAGWIAGAKAAHPDLTAYELNALTLIAARPVNGFSGNDQEEYIQYINNGRHLPYNPIRAGFGYVDENSHMLTSLSFAAYKNANPNLADTEITLDTSYHMFSDNEAEPITLPERRSLHKAYDTIDLKFYPDAPYRTIDACPIKTTSPPSTGFSFNENAFYIAPETPKASPETIEAFENTPAQENKTVGYKIAVSDDALALRVNVALRFKNNAVPRYVFLTNPQGGRIPLSPTKVLSFTHSYSLASTDGHFGNYTKGDWIIEVLDGYELEEARLTINGFPKDGVLDSYMQDYVDPKSEFIQDTLNTAPNTSPSDNLMQDTQDNDSFTFMFLGQRFKLGL